LSQPNIIVPSELTATTPKNEIRIVILSRDCLGTHPDRPSVTRAAGHGSLTAGPRQSRIGGPALVYLTCADHIGAALTDGFAKNDVLLIRR
jgi:hypothetical protein